MAIFQDDAPHVAGTVITVTVLAYLTLALRVYTRITRRSWGTEDWLMTVAAFPFAVLSISCLVASFNGIGVHASTLALAGNQKYTELGQFWFFMFEVFYCTAIIPIKLSIGFMLVRVAEKRKVYVYAQYIIMSMFSVMNFIAVLYIIFQCNPVSAAWDPALIEEGNHCNDPIILADIYYATTAVNIFTDWATALMPIPLLWNVKLNINAKMSVGAILGLGVFASLSACIRLKYTINLTDSTDYLFGVANIMLWGYAENGIGMLVGNIATLRPLFRKMLHLGGSDSNTAPSKFNTPSDIPSNSRHPYKPFDTNYEMGTMSLGREKQGSTMSTQIQGGAEKNSRTSLDSDSDSQRQIVDRRASGGGPTGIVVSRQINVSHSQQ